MARLDLLRCLTVLGSTIALSAAASSKESEARSSAVAPRALALSVVEHGDHVEIELIAQSEVTQRVDFALALSGSSTARHSGNSAITAGERHVLSRLRAGCDDSWCARVEVTESKGAHYTLTAGNCA